MTPMPGGYIYLTHVHTNVYHVGKIDSEDIYQFKKNVSKEFIFTYFYIDRDLDEALQILLKEIENVFFRIYDPTL